MHEWLNASYTSSLRPHTLVASSRTHLRSTPIIRVSKTHEPTVALHTLMTQEEALKRARASSRGRAS
jgi:hypothetical protein